MEILRMTDDELLEQFETLTLPEESFHHRDHVRLTRIYLSRYPILDVLGRLSAGLAATARMRGRPERYHETITWAFVFLVRERMARTGANQSWEEFANANVDLLNWKESVLRGYYQDVTLRSDLARRTFLLPDRLLA
jgi:hypothetical protein